MNSNNRRRQRQRFIRLGREHRARTKLLDRTLRDIYIPQIASELYRPSWFETLLNKQGKDL